MKYEDGKISFSLISSTFHRKNGIKHVYTKDEIDYFSLYNIECDKLLLLPIYYLSLNLLNKNYLTEKEKLFFLFGLLAFSLRCILLMNNLIGRFSYYFWLPSILPIYYYIKYLIERKLQFKVLCCLIYSSIIYFIKVIMAVNEYKYEFYI